VAVVFSLMVAAWAGAAALGLDNTAVALLGLGVLMATGIYTADDLKQEGNALGTFVWFAALFALSTALDQTGFTTFVGEKLAAGLEGVPWPAAHVLLVLLYVLLHYLFVSQTAHLLALMPVFLGVGSVTGVPLALLAFSLLFANNYFSALTPQASSANVLFAASGYVEPRDLYRTGAAVTAALIGIHIAIGAPWILFVWGRL
jgi:divalent anion:Na+ symporter, DASS family